MKNDKSMQTQPTSPEIYWHPCADTNRAFLCVAGVDNNLAEIFAIEADGFRDAHDNAARIVRQIADNARLTAQNAALVEALEAALEHAEALQESGYACPQLLAIGRAALAQAKGQP